MNDLPIRTAQAEARLLARQMHEQGRVSEVHLITKLARHQVLFDGLHTAMLNAGWKPDDVLRRVKAEILP